MSSFDFERRLAAVRNSSNDNGERRLAEQWQGTRPAFAAPRVVLAPVPTQRSIVAQIVLALVLSAAAGWTLASVLA